jgi:CHAT domain-containing protein
VRAAGSVVVCADDETGRVPFEALPLDGVPLGVRCAVERAPSLSVWARLRARPERAGSAVVVDSVALPAAAAAELGVQPLAFSAAEGDAVAAAWPGARRVRGEAATLAGVRAAGQDGTGVQHVSVLHVSAHALVRSVVPSESLLLLLAELPLRGATVVLSACSSAAGKAHGGEGEASLLWGPLGAGARAVVASLWPVNQQATCDLMGQFHHWLARGSGEAEALRLARATLAAAPNYAHPHYWAGFAAFGSHATAPGWPRGSLLFAGAGLAVLLVGVWRVAVRRS